MLLVNTEEDLCNMIVDAKHPFRKINQIIDFTALAEPMRACYSTLGDKGIDVERGIKALLGKEEKESGAFFLWFWISKMPSKMRKNTMPRRFAPRQFLTISQKVKIGGDDWRNFEPISRPRTTVSFNRIGRIVKELRRIHKENPAYFDVPAFAQKVY